MLTEIGVDFAQGYAIHKPQPFEEILGLLSHNSGAS
jgi:EAL domain-containing protein (putative c-di-GMP-specific phosphodiesterase class I)